MELVANRRIWNKQSRTSVTPTGNKLQQFSRAAGFAPQNLVITLNPMEKVEPNIRLASEIRRVLASWNTPAHLKHFPVRFLYV